MIDEDMKYCAICNLWVEPEIVDHGYNTDRGFCTVFVAICRKCEEETSSVGPICNGCDCRVNPDECEMVSGDYYCEECLAIEETEL